MSSIFGLLGEKLGHSISPQIHKIIFEECNIQGNYNLFEVKKENLKTAVEGLKALGVKGVNVTIPYKVDVMEYLDSISLEAEKIGAVNTILFGNKGAIGYNTDYFGFGRLLDKYNIETKNKKIIVLGTGGASKAITQYFKDNGAKEIVLVTRNLENANNIKAYSVIDYNQLMNNYLSGDIIVNCTPSGMHPKVDSSPVDKNIIRKFGTAVDLIYNPYETLFLKQAKESGLKIANGLYMLIGQALEAERLWNNISLSEDIEDKIFNNLMENIYD